MEGGDLRMSNIVDSRVVEMTFKNSEFERGVTQSLASLERLKKGLKLDGATSGLDHIQKTVGKGLNLSSIASGVQTISSRFTSMGVIGTAALASVAAQAVQTGLAFAKNLTVAPLKAGLEEYETNLNSVQTILANTGLEGQKGLDRVNVALQNLNTYSDKTIYNFSQMARNIGTFTAAGVDLDTSTAAIKGIANLAAISGSNAEQASTAMYQLSQALAAGKATLVDWNSVVNAGMGGKVFQEALKETARNQGVAIDELIKKNGSFRDSLQEGWLTDKVLTETLAKFTGDLTESQLKSMGYNDKQIAGILKMGRTAQDAATKVKTMSQLINTLQEAAGSGWSKTFQLLFGDFGEARTLFTNVNNVLGGFIQRSSDARNKVLSDWKALGGRTVLIEGIGIAFNNVMAILKPIKQAFRDIFPPATGKNLYNLTVQFRNFMLALKPGQETLENLRRTFRGVFAIFSIGFSIVKGIFTAIKQLFSAFEGGSGGILEFTGDIGDWLVALDQAIKKGEGFKNFFVGLGKVLAAPIVFLKIVIGLIKDLITGVDDIDIGDLSDRFAPLERLGGGISAAWSGVVKILEGVWKIFEPLADKFSDFFAGFSDLIADAFSGADYSQVLDSVNTGLLAGLVLLFKKFLSGGINIDLGGGLFSKIGDSFESLTGIMTAMQTQLKANALLKIGGAIALITASVVALSLIDSKRLATALTGLGVMFTQMLAAMAIMDKIVASKGFLKLPFLTTSMIALALAIDLLAVAVTVISRLSWEELAKGLTGTAVLLGSLALFTRFSQANAVSGAGIILLALGIKILVDAVKDFSDISWSEMAKGLIGVGALLGALAIFTKLTAAAKGGVLQGAGLLLLAAGIKVLASAIEDMGQLSWSQIAKGLVAMAGGLGIMATALALVPPSSIFTAAGIFIVASSLSKIGDAMAKMGSLSWGEIARGLVSMAGALTLIATALALLPPTTIFSAAAIFVAAASLGMIGDALGQMGGMSWEEIAKGLVTLAGALGILAGGLYLMTGTLGGSAALLVAAVALRTLAPVIQTFGAMSLGEIAKGLGAMAGVFVVLGAAGLLLAPLVPILLSLGVAIGLMGVGMLAAGGGMALFGIGLTAVAAAGAAAIGVLIGGVRAVLNFLPEVIEKLGDVIVSLANAIAKASPAVVKAIVTVLMSLLNAIVRYTPQITAKVAQMVVKMLTTLRTYVPQMSTAGTNLLIAILNAIAKNAGKMTTAATNVMVKFIQGISNNLPRVTQAGVDLIINLINAIADQIRASGPALGEAGANLGLAIIEGMAGAIGAGVGTIAAKAKDVAKSALDAAKGVLGIKSPSKEFEKIGKFVILGFRKGLDGNKSQINSAFASLKSQIDAFKKDTLSDINAMEKRLAEMTKPGTLGNVVEIAKLRKAIAAARSEYNKMNYAQITATKWLRDDQILLGHMADSYDRLSAKLAYARGRVNELTKARDEYRKSITDQYSDLQTPEDDETAREFVDAGKKQLEDLKKFTKLIAQLKAKGINEELYRDLLQKGTSSIPFIENLLAGGDAAISEVNKLEKDLQDAGQSLGNQASSALYNAGISAAVGLVKGLEKQQANLEAMMDKLANRMVAAIKKSLGIKSPSKVMAEIGRYSVEGMTSGLDRYSDLAEKSAKDLGENTIDAMRKAMSGVSDILITDPDFRPTVRPILDLSEVKKDASGINGMFKTLPIGVTAAKARDASNGVRTNQALREEIEEDRLAAISYTQNNYSPKALTNAEIYRQTKNQLSVTKGALKT
jgi:tape measure domain-containing protein